MIRVCFVCLGNICRSPMAEGIFRHLVEKEGHGGRFVVESAGTADYHVGDPPDPRTVRAAAKHGVRVSGQGAHFRPVDFERFDHVLALDRAIERSLLRIATTGAERRKVVLLRRFDDEAAGALDVEDPYYGDDDGFDETYDVCLRACEGLLDHLLADRR